MARRILALVDNRSRSLILSSSSVFRFCADELTKVNCCFYVDRIINFFSIWRKKGGLLVPFSGSCQRTLIEETWKPQKEENQHSWQCLKDGRLWRLPFSVAVWTKKTINQYGLSTVSQAFQHRHTIWGDYELQFVLKWCGDIGALWANSHQFKRNKINKMTVRKNNTWKLHVYIRILNVEFNLLSVFKKKLRIWSTGVVVRLCMSRLKENQLINKDP